MPFKHLQGVVVAPDKVLGTLLINGQHCPVTNVFDLDGDETTILADAYSAVALLPDGKWISLCVDLCGILPLQ